MEKLDEALMLRALRLNASMAEWNAKTEQERLKARKQRLAISLRLSFVLNSMNDEEWLEYRFVTAVNK